MTNLLSISLNVLLCGVLSAIILFIVQYFIEDEKLNYKQKIGIIFLTCLGVFCVQIYSRFYYAHTLFLVFLIVTSAIDIKTKTVFVTLTCLLGGLSILSLLLYKVNFYSLITGGIIGFSFYLMIYLGAKWFYKREAFGFGDVIYMGLIGSFVGGWYALLAGLLTFYIAILAIIFQGIFKKNLSRKMEIAFAPYMSLSAWLVSLFGIQMVELYLKFFMK